MGSEMCIRDRVRYDLPGRPFNITVSFGEQHRQPLEQLNHHGLAYPVVLVGVIASIGHTHDEEGQRVKGEWHAHAGNKLLQILHEGDGVATELLVHERHVAKAHDGSEPCHEKGLRQRGVVVHWGVVCL